MGVISRPMHYIWELKAKIKMEAHIPYVYNATPWTVTPQAPVTMGFSRQEYWSGLPFPSPMIFPTQRSNPGLLYC